MTPSLTVERLKTLLDCDSGAGVFTWKTAPHPRIKVGSPAGWQHAKGYWYVQIDGACHLRHRLVWLYVHGHWPVGCLDHVNGYPGDDRIGNLRDATFSQNQANRRRNAANRSGFKGVKFHKRDKLWQAKIQRNKRAISLGYYKTAAEAHAAYCRAAAVLDGEYARFA